MIYSFIDTLAQSYLEDGVITWKADRKRRFTRKVFDHIMGQTGIEFQRVSKDSDAEIDIAFVDQVNERDSSGWASTYATGKSDISIKRGVWYWRTVVSHEIGHALGMDHDHDDVASVMSYNRDVREWEWDSSDFDKILPHYEPFL